MTGNEAPVTRSGIESARPGREAPADFRTVRRRRGRRRGGRGELSMVPEAEFRSYYGQPVINKPVWSSTDIAGYLFLGGLAGASSVVGAAADARGEQGLAKVSKAGAAGAGLLSMAALIHDLGKPMRFLHMLRVVKVTSPMNIGSWLLSGYVPAALVAAGSALAGRVRPLGVAGTVGAAALGPAVASYTGALVSDTAVPAWHDGYREMPFLFVGSGAMAAGGLGLLAAPSNERDVPRRVALLGALTEVGFLRAMEHRLGYVAEPYKKGRGGGLIKAGEGLAAAGSALAILGARPWPGGRVAEAVAGTMLLTGSACTRFGIFHAGIASAQDPRYTVQPQRERLRARAAREHDVLAAPVSDSPSESEPAPEPITSPPSSPTSTTTSLESAGATRHKTARHVARAVGDAEASTTDPGRTASIEFWQQPDGQWRWRWKSPDDGTVLVSHRAFDSMGEAAESAQSSFPETLGSGRSSGEPVAHPVAAGAAVLGALAAGALRRWRRR